MNTASSVAVAAIFVWLGMVLAISFLEAPMKFRAPGVTMPIGLGIGRLVFRALNTIEAVLAVVVLAALTQGGAPGSAITAVAVAVLALCAQLLAVRPRLRRRSDVVLAGSGAASASRSRAHYAYLALEIVKVVGLIVGGVALLAG
jgi:hypothetical protein